MQDKINNTENLIIKLKDIAKKSIVKGKYDKALASLSACADVLYEYNQRYKDDEIEDMLLELGDKIISVPDDFKPKNIKPVKTVLYYDGFGLDLRGLAINMTSNIASLGYKLIYVTHAGSKGKQNHIVKELEGYDVEYVYLDTDSGYLKWALELNQVFQKFRNKKPEVLRMILRSYARNISTEAAVSTIISDIRQSNERTLDTKTYDDYMEALKDLYIIEDLDAWNPNIRSKTSIRSTPTRHFVDTSVACRALGVSPGDLLKDSSLRISPCGISLSMPVSLAEQSNITVTTPVWNVMLFCTLMMAGGELLK